MILSWGPEHWSLCEKLRTTFLLIQPMPTWCWIPIKVDLSMKLPQIGTYQRLGKRHWSNCCIYYSRLHHSSPYFLIRMPSKGTVHLFSGSGCKLGKRVSETLQRNQPPNIEYDCSTSGKMSIALCCSGCVMYCTGTKGRISSAIGVMVWSNRPRIIGQSLRKQGIKKNHTTTAILYTSTSFTSTNYLCDALKITYVMMRGMPASCMIGSSSSCCIPWYTINWVHHNTSLNFAMRGRRLHTCHRTCHFRSVMCWTYILVVLTYSAFLTVNAVPLLFARGVRFNFVCSTTFLQVRKHPLLVEYYN